MFDLTTITEGYNTRITEIMVNLGFRLEVLKKWGKEKLPTLEWHRDIPAREESIEAPLVCRYRLFVSPVEKGDTLVKLDSLNLGEPLQDKRLDIQTVFADKEHLFQRDLVESFLWKEIEKHAEAMGFYLETTRREWREPFLTESASPPTVRQLVLPSYGSIRMTWNGFDDVVSFYRRDSMIVISTGEFFELKDASDLSNFFYAYGDKMIPQFVLPRVGEVIQSPTPKTDTGTGQKH